MTCRVVVEEAVARLMVIKTSKTFLIIGTNNYQRKKKTLLGSLNKINTLHKMMLLMNIREDNQANQKVNQMHLHGVLKKKKI